MASQNDALGRPVCEVHAREKAPTVWLCCRCMDVERPACIEINGIFSTRELAVAACTSWRDWIVPLSLNERLPEETTEMTLAEWPRINERHKEDKA